MAQPILFAELTGLRNLMVVSSLFLVLVLLPSLTANILSCFNGWYYLFAFYIFLSFLIYYRWSFWTVETGFVFNPVEQDSNINSIEPIPAAGKIRETLISIIKRDKPYLNPQLYLAYRVEGAKKRLQKTVFSGKPCRSIVVLKILAKLGIDQSQTSLTTREKKASMRDLLMARSDMYLPAEAETDFAQPLYL